VFVAGFEAQEQGVQGVQDRQYSKIWTGNEKHGDFASRLELVVTRQDIGELFIAGESRMG